MKEGFETLTFEEAVRLFKKWGFRIEQGPGTEEMTIIYEGTSHRSYYVCQPEQLVEMAGVILRQRLRMGAMAAPVLDIQ